MHGYFCVMDLKTGQIQGNLRAAPTLILCTRVHKLMPVRSVPCLYGRNLLRCEVACVFTWSPWFRYGDVVKMLFRIAHLVQESPPIDTQLSSKCLQRDRALWL